MVVPRTFGRHWFSKNLENIETWKNFQLKQVIENLGKSEKDVETKLNLGNVFRLPIFISYLHMI